MGANRIELTKGNSLTVNCTISGLADLTGFTAKLIVKNKLTDTAEEKKFEITGTIAALVATFVITKTQNDINAETYFYEIYIDDGSDLYTVTQDDYHIKQGVRV